tara:strand:+ start:203 stop:424 length:222 start_codon:yes stop_codon:yes gene_type:complete
MCRTKDTKEAMMSETRIAKRILEIQKYQLETGTNERYLMTLEEALVAMKMMTGEPLEPDYDYNEEDEEVEEYL